MDIAYPQLAYSKTYFTQIAITAPNGYLECEVFDTFEFRSNYSSKYWYMIGDWTFNMIFDKNAYIPSGTWMVDLYWDGMHVNRSTIYVN